MYKLNLLLTVPIHTGGNICTLLSTNIHTYTYRWTLCACANLLLYDVGEIHVYALLIWNIFIFIITSLCTYVIVNDLGGWLLLMILLRAYCIVTHFVSLSSRHKPSQSGTSTYWTRHSSLICIYMHIYAAFVYTYSKYVCMCKNEMVLHV